MKKLNKGGEWEKEWADAFEQASLQPSESIWAGIDGHLANKELRKYKKRAVVFQWVAAASVFFSLCGAAWLFIQSSGQDVVQPLTDRQEIITAPDAEETLLALEPKAVGESAEEEGNTSTLSKNEEEKALAVKPAGPEESSSRQGIAGAEPAKKNSQEAVISPTDNTSLASTHSSNPYPSKKSSLESTVLALAETGNGRQPETAGMQTVEKNGFMDFDHSTKPVTAAIHKVWLPSDMLKKKKETEPARFWLGATLASNAFDPNFQDNDLSLQSLGESDFQPTKKNQVSTARVSQWNEEQSMQVSINAGVQAAAWIGKKWVLQGGVQYGSYQSGATAGTYIDQESSQAYPLHYANLSYDKVQMARPGSRFAAPVAVTNSFKFISVPMQLGYVVFDRQLSLLLSPGISSEFFLRNQLSDKENRLSTFTVYSGNDAPFHTVHLKGILGAQLFYKIGDNYMISLEPSYQHALTNFSKSNSLFKSRPSNMGIAAGFRYIIR